MNTIYYVGLDGRRCGLTTESRAEVFKREGSAHVTAYRPATDDEIQWVKAMGGFVPIGRCHAAQKKAEA